MAVVTVSISIDGKEMDPKIVLLYVDVIREMNRIPKAEIRLLEPDTFSKGFQVSDTGKFQPGKPVEIKLRYEGQSEKESLIFGGIIVRQEISATVGESLLTLFLQDLTFQMTTNRKSAYFKEKADQAIIKEILGTYPKIKPGKIPPTKPAHKEMLQYYCSDWDFILSRAEANGLLIAVNEGKVDLIKPKISGKPKHSFEMGGSLIRNLEMESDLRYQYKTIQSQGWDSEKNAMTAPAKAAEAKLYPGKTDPAKIASKLGTTEFNLISGVPAEKEELTAWANAQMVKSRLAMVRGTLTLPGIGDVRPGDIMELIGVAKAFDGITLVTGVRQQVTPNGWETIIQFGMDHNWISSESNLIDTPAAGLLPGINGLQIGLVDKFVEDKSKQVRVKVQIPALDAKKASVWARLATLDAGKKRGTFFRPEVGDEVILGFLNDDPRQPVILGSLYNKTNAHLLKPDAKNNEKGFMTREGLTLLFNDEEKSILIETKEKQSILLSEKDKKITIMDSLNKNTITLDKDGITISGDKDLNVDVKGDINLTAKGKIVLSAPEVDTK